MKDNKKKSGTARFISYREALQEALIQEMTRDKRVISYGIGVPDSNAIFGSTTGLQKMFGPERVFDTPISEDAMTGFGLGAAINGLRPVHHHIRIDFLLLAMNQLANMVSTAQYGSGGQLKVPFVIRAVIGRGWGQGFQHSKSMQSIFAHIPGLKVVMPTTPYDAKGFLIAAIRDENPVLILEHRWLYWQEGNVPKESYTVPIGTPQLLRKGKDITIVATSWMNVEAAHAADILAKRGVQVEIVDVRTLAPLDDGLIMRSVKKTGNCIVADLDWVDYGVSGELAARIYQKCFGHLTSPIERIGFAHTPTPTGRILEDEFYPNAATIVRAVERQLKLSPTDLSKENFYSHENRFRGPF
jgi:pyruvate/2-oxoglutarate/acetoin dehydrogenase E1 component